MLPRTVADPGQRWQSDPGQSHRPGQGGRQIQGRVTDPGQGWQIQGSGGRPGQEWQIQGRGASIENNIKKRIMKYFSENFFPINSQH